MGIFNSESEEERTRRKDEAQIRKAADRERRDQERATEERSRQHAKFVASPQGMARTCYQRGDALFQVSLDLENIQNHVIAMESAYTTRHAIDVSDVLNAIHSEGWQFHSFSTTFVNEGEISRDRFLASGQQVAVQGRVYATYVFTRRISQ